MRNRVIVFAVLTLLWCGFIFYMSAEDSSESTERSDEVISAVCEVVDPEFKNYTEEKKDSIIDDFSLLVRKAAHFSLYAVLGALAFQTFCFIRRKKLRSLAAVLFACLYSCTDELHQLYVPGRSGELRDILIDTSGAVLAVAITLLVLWLMEKKKQQPEKES